jgi:hypothetical protein
VRRGEVEREVRGSRNALGSFKMGGQRLLAQASPILAQHLTGPSHWRVCFLGIQSEGG